MRTGRSITKGVIWELTGVLMLVGYGLITHNDSMYKVAFGWPIARTLMWPAYEWCFKKIWYKATVEQ